MSITRIVRVPEVGEVGTKATFRGSGTPVGTELRYYLAFAPVSSKLPTLETTTDRAKTRLEVDQSGAGYFTPDVPGHYQVECHDVTVTSTPQKWGGAPKVPDTDNDFAGAPVVDLSSGGGTARYRGQADFQAVQTVSRTIGQAPNTLTFTLRVRDDVEWLLPDAVTVTAGPGPIAQIAQYDDSMLAVRDLLREGRVRNNAAMHLAGSPHALLQANLGRCLFQALDRWMLHITEDADRLTHLDDDDVNVVSDAEVTTLAGAITRLGALRTAYEAHRISTTYHVEADTRNAFPSLGVLPLPVDLTTALNFTRIAFQIMRHGPNETDEVTYVFAVAMDGHGIEGRHVLGDINDPEAAASFDFSSSLPGLLRGVNELTRWYNAHRIRVTQDPAHNNADTHNDIRLFGSFGSGSPPIDVPTGITLVNELAECIERHTGNLQRDGTTYGNWHQKVHPLKVQQRAADLPSAVAVLETCCALMEAHALDGGTAVSAHASKVWGARYGNIEFFDGNNHASWPLMTRAQIHLRAFQAQATPPVPAHLNTLPPALSVLGWK